MRAYIETPRGLLLLGVLSDVHRLFWHILVRMLGLRDGAERRWRDEEVRILGSCKERFW